MIFTISTADYDSILNQIPVISSIIGQTGQNLLSALHLKEVSHTLIELIQRVDTCIVLLNMRPLKHTDIISYDESHHHPDMDLDEISIH